MQIIILWFNISHYYFQVYTLPWYFNITLIQISFFYLDGPFPLDHPALKANSLLDASFTKETLLTEDHKLICYRREMKQRKKIP